VVAVANDAQQGLCVCGVGIADDGNLPGLRKSICQRLELPAKAQWILAHHGLHLGQRLVDDIDIT
jgi:hypothetical protein